MRHRRRVEISHFKCQYRREERQSCGLHEACPPHTSAGIVANMTPSTVAQYLAALPADRRAALSAVRRSVTGVRVGLH